MALSYLNLGKASKKERTHDDANVGPFYAPENPQFGIRPNLAEQHGAEPARRPNDGEPSTRGTASDLRGRNARLRGASAPPAPWPMPPIRRMPNLRGSYSREEAQEPQEDSLPAADAEEALPPPPSDLGSEPRVYEWNAERLDAIDSEVYTNIPRRLKALEDTLEHINNGVVNTQALDGFMSEAQRKRERYHMDVTSSQASSPDRAIPGETSPAPPPGPPPTAETFTISTPVEAGVSYGSGAVGSGGEGGDKEEPPQLRRDLDAMKKEMEHMVDSQHSFKTLFESKLDNLNTKIFTGDLVINALDAKLQQLEDVILKSTTQIKLLEKTSRQHNVEIIEQGETVASHVHALDSMPDTVAQSVNGHYNDLSTQVRKLQHELNVIKDSDLPAQARHMQDEMDAIKHAIAQPSNANVQSDREVNRVSFVDNNIHARGASVPDPWAGGGKPQSPGGAGGAAPSPAPTPSPAPAAPSPSPIGQMPSPPGVGSQMGWQQPQQQPLQQSIFGDHDDDDDDDPTHYIDPLEFFTMDEYRRWNLDVKHEKISHVFGGRSENYVTWRDLMIDVCSGSWFGWRGLLERIVKRETPLTSAVIRATHQWMGLSGGQLTILSTILWSHLGRCMNTTQRRNRKRTAGESLNGFELWRRLHWDHLDGDVASDRQKSKDFREFPRCSTCEGLQSHIDEWQLLRQEVAGGTPDGTLLLQFYYILPQAYSEQLQDDPTCDSLEEAMKRAGAKCRRYNQTRLAKLEHDRREATIKDKGPMPFVHAAVPPQLPAQSPAQSPQPTPTPTPQTINDLTKHVTEAVVAAIRSKGKGKGKGDKGDRRSTSPGGRGRGRYTGASARQRSESPKLWRDGACLECGSKDHNKRNCPVMKEKFPKGRAPIGYRGAAYDEDMAKQAAAAAAASGPNAAAVIAGPLQAPQQQTGAWAVLPPAIKAGCCPVLNADFDEQSDDEGHMMAAICQISADDGTIIQPRCTKQDCKGCPMDARLQNLTTSSTSNTIATSTNDNTATATETKESIDAQSNPKPSQDINYTKPKTHMPPMPAKAPQASNKKKPKEVTRERVLQVIQDIEAGKLSPPKLKKTGTRLCLADSGSAPNVANHKRHFPGSALVRGDEKYNQFVTATGQPFGSCQKMVVDAESLEGYKRRITFQDTDVTLPILSIGLMTDDDNDVLFQKRGGKSIHNPTGEIIEFTRMHGVYFIEPKFDHDLLTPPTTKPDHVPQDFGVGVGA